MICLRGLSAGNVALRRSGSVGVVHCEVTKCALKKMICPLGELVKTIVDVLVMMFVMFVVGMVCEDGCAKMDG